MRFPGFGDGFGVLDDVDFIRAVGPVPSVAIVAYAAPYEAEITAVGPIPVVSVSASAAPVTASIAAAGPLPRVAAVASAADYSDNGWQIRAVTATGKLVSLIGGVSIERHHDGINGDEYVDVSIPTQHSDAALFDLFRHEVQFWLDGEFRMWGTPARLNADRADLSIRVDGLFAYAHDNLVGGKRPNHIVAPHEDPSPIGSPPTYWTAASGVDEYAMVDNAYVYHQEQRSVQINDADTEDENSYVWQRYTVTDDLHRVPFAANCWVHIADSYLPIAPPWGGSSFEDRGLVVVRYDSDGTTPIGDPAIAQINANSPRNMPHRLQTPEVVPDAGDVLEVRLYCPDAWVSYRIVELLDGRGPEVYMLDKTVAVRTLVEHFQDTTIGKQNHRIGTSISQIGEAITQTWPWHRRDNVGELIENLADSFEFRMENTATTRTLRAARTVGVKLPDIVTKADGLTAWALAVDRLNTHSRIFHQGEGSGVARDEWVAEASGSALSGNKREGLMFGPVGSHRGPLRDAAEEILSRTRSVQRLPQVTVTGELAKKIRAGDTITIDLDHGWAQYQGQARALAVDFDGSARTAALSLEPVVA